jgi:hypothetical protein
VEKALRLGSVLCLVVFVVGGVVSAQVNITTWQSDTLRTGQNNNETILSPTNLASSNFGQLCNVGLDGQVYAQPLVLSNVTFNGTQYSSLVYVVTQNSTLYVINGTPPAQGNPCAIVSSLSLIPAGQYPVDCQYVGAGACQTVKPIVGILSTPVIQQVPNSNGILYTVTQTQDVPLGQVPRNWYHNVHAVSLDTLTEITPPVRVLPPGPGLQIIQPIQASFWSHHHIQRPGLLLVNNYLYIGFSMADGNLPLFDGAVYRYDVTNLNAPPLTFTTTPDFAPNGGGIWQGGAGLAYGPDESGNNYIYFNTGNGNWDGAINYGDSFVKLDPTSLTVPTGAYFTPSDEYYRNCQGAGKNYIDLDFGSGGVLLLPATSNWPHLAVSGDKEGGMWAMDRGAPGGFNQGQCQQNCNACPPNEQGNQNVQTVWLPPGLGTGPAVHTNPSYWNNFVYIAPVNAPISQYQVCNDLGSGQPFCGSALNATAPNGTAAKTPYGATPVISASSPTSNGILWLLAGVGSSESTTAGQLYAFNATTMQGVYVNSGPGSNCAQVDGLYAVTKFSVPTVANGYVYVGAESANTTPQNTGLGTFYIFGLNRQCGSTARRIAPVAASKPSLK